VSLGVDLVDWRWDDAWLDDAWRVGAWRAGDWRDGAWRVGGLWGVSLEITDDEDTMADFDVIDDFERLGMFGSFVF
jgi:hypothetical protein